jgi:hypothetical protein
MERAIKLLVLAWTAVALAVQVWLLQGGAWPSLGVLAPAGFVATAALTAFDRRAVGAVLVVAYLLPAILFHYLGRPYWPHHTLWMVLVLGAITPDAIRTTWRIPSTWRVPLQCCAMVVIAGASIVSLREIDFTPELFFGTAVANTAGGGWPSFYIGWVLNAAVIVLLGILWFDWLLGLPVKLFRTAVATPLALSAVILAGVALYQLFVDMSFLNASVYLSLGRASGTVFDANVCGTIAALWIGGWVLLANGFSRGRPYVAAPAVLLCWLAVWATGSRTAFAAAAIASAFVLRGLLSGAVTRAVAVRLVLAAAAAAVLLAVLASIDVAAVGPLARFRATLPAASPGAVGDFLTEQLWNRNRYGTMSTAMIREYPLVGVGVGSFQMMLPEFAPRFGGPIPPDNAQNWLRHQLAELGVLGSLPWLAWLAAFGSFVVRRRSGDPPAAWSARGALVAFAAISFVGMAGQEVLVAITFWTFAAWYVMLVGAPAEAGSPAKRRAAIVSAIVVIGFTAGTTYAATHDLRVPVRAARVGWPYMYGFYPPEQGVGDGDQRWTKQHAVAVVPATARWLELTYSVDYRSIAHAMERRSAQAATRPVGITIRVDGEVVTDTTLTTTAPVTTYTRVPEGRAWLLIETGVSRTVRPRDFGVADDRELGMLVRWSFVDAPAAR